MMNAIKCEDISEMLVEYADGELSADQERIVEEHLQSCQRCAYEVKMLRRSLECAHDVWDGCGAEVARPVRKQTRWWIGSAAGVAAMVLVMLSLYGGGDNVNLAPAMTLDELVAKVEIDIENAGIAGELLAKAEILAKNKEYKDIARNRLKFITETFPETGAAKEAKVLLAQR